MSENYQNELNKVIVKFANVLGQIDPEMNELGFLINQKLNRYEDDFSYSSLISRVNNISQKLMECYELIGKTAGEINLCIQRLRNITNSESDYSIIKDYPQSITNFTNLVNDHVQFVKSIKQSIIDWDGVNKHPESIVNTDKKIFEYLNSLEDSSYFYIKITGSVNKFLD
jgi:hypothetical protein